MFALALKHSQFKCVCVFALCLNVRRTYLNSLNQQLTDQYQLETSQIDLLCKLFVFVLFSDVSICKRTDLNVG